MKKILPIGWGVLLIAIGLTLAVPMITTAVVPIIMLIGAFVAAVVIIRAATYFFTR